MSTDPPDRLDRWIPRLMVVVVLAVATFAFTESYSHIYYLAQAHRETGAALRMLPLSVDLVMVGAGLVMLHLKRKRIRHPLPRAALYGGATVTLAANVAFGIVFGWEAAVISAWAPIALFIAVELGMLLVNTAKAKPEGEVPAGIIKFDGVLTEEAAAEIKRQLEASGFNGNGYRPETQLRQSQGTHDPSPETATFPRQVDSPEPAQGWGQLAGQEPAEPGRPGLNGIGLRNRGQ